MAAKQSPLHELVVSRVLHLNATAYGAVTGLFVGFAVFIVTIWLVIKGGEVVGPHLKLLGQFFLGYEVTLWGSFVGLAYGFLFGFFGGYLAASIYNGILGIVGKQSSETKDSQ